MAVPGGEDSGRRSAASNLSSTSSEDSDEDIIRSTKELVKLQDSYARADFRTAIREKLGALAEQVRATAPHTAPSVAPPTLRARPLYPPPPVMLPKGARQEMPPPPRSSGATPSSIVAGVGPSLPPFPPPPLHQGRTMPPPPGALPPLSLGRSVEPPPRWSGGPAEGPAPGDAGAGERDADAEEEAEDPDDVEEEVRRREEEKRTKEREEREAAERAELEAEEATRKELLERAKREAAEEEERALKQLEKEQQEEDATHRSRLSRKSAQQREQQQVVLAQQKGSNPTSGQTKLAAYRSSARGPGILTAASSDSAESGEVGLDDPRYTENIKKFYGSSVHKGLKKWRRNTLKNRLEIIQQKLQSKRTSKHVLDQQRARIHTEIPRPVHLVIMEEAYPVVLQTVKLYVQQLGLKSPYSREAIIHLRKLATILGRKCEY